MAHCSSGFPTQGSCWAGWHSFTSPCPHCTPSALSVCTLNAWGWGWTSALLFSQPGMLCAHTIHSGTDGLLWLASAEHPGETVSACSETGLQVGAGYTHPFFFFFPEHRGKLPVLHSQDLNSLTVWSQLLTGPHALTSYNNRA